MRGDLEMLNTNEEIMTPENQPKVFDINVKYKQIRRGQIRWCTLEPDKNSKFIGKRRPCIIFQTGKWNNTQDCTIGVIPLSHSPMYCSCMDDLYALNLVCDDPNSYFYQNGDNGVSYIGLNRILFIARERVNEYIADSPKELMDDIIMPYLAKRFGLNTNKKEGK